MRKTKRNLTRCWTWAAPWALRAMALQRALLQARRRTRCQRGRRRACSTRLSASALSAHGAAVRRLAQVQQHVKLLFVFRNVARGDPEVGARLHPVPVLGDPAEQGGSRNNAGTHIPRLDPHRDVLQERGRGTAQ